MLVKRTTRPTVTMVRMRTVHLLRKYLNQGFADQSLEMVEHDAMLEDAYPCGQFQIECISQRTQPPEERLFIHAQTIVAPLDGRLQATMARVRRAQAVDKEMVCPR